MALTYGSRGDDVLEYQKQMKAAGFDPGPLDGNYGDRTKAADTAYKAAMNQATSSIAAPAAPVDPTSGLVGLRSAAERAGGSVTWDPTKGAMVNGATIDTSRMKNIGGRWYGSAEDVYGQLATTKAPDYQTGGGMFSQEDMQGLINKILNPGAFTIDESNPMISAMRTQGQKTGERAFNENIAALTAGTGGQLSSWAASQASGARAGAAQDADAAIAELAYGMWQDEQNRNMSSLNALLGIDDTMYGRNHDEYDDFRDAVGTGLDMADRDYQRGVSDKEYNRGVYESDRAFAQDKTNADRNYNLQVRQENRLSSGGSGESDTDITKLGTPDQVSAYYSFIDIFSGGGNGTYKGDPAAAYNKLVGNRGQIEGMVDTKLYKQLLADVKSLESVVGQEKADAPESYDVGSDPVAKRAIDMMGETNEVTGRNSMGAPTTQKVAKYTDQDIITYVLNNVMDEEQAAAILNYLDVKEPVVGPQKSSGGALQFKN